MPRPTETDDTAGNAGAPVWRIGMAVFEPVPGLVTAGGGPVRIRPKVAALLDHLCRHAGRLVTRDELMQAVWPDVVVTDDSITQCVAAIRRALQRDAVSLRTLQRRGYMLVAAARQADPLPRRASRTPPARLVPELLEARLRELEARIADIERRVRLGELLPLERGAAVAARHGALPAAAQPVIAALPKTT